MRWSIIRLIWLRELRDQLRDRRTIFMIAVLPILLYPIAGIGLKQFVFGFLGQHNKVRIVGANNLPRASPRPIASLLACTPPPPGCLLAGVERVVGACALSARCREMQFAPLVESVGGKDLFLEDYFDAALDRESLVIQLAPDEHTSPDTIDRADLKTRDVDLILFVPPDFAAGLEKGKPELHILMREGDDRSRLVYNRVNGILKRWKTRLKETRLLHNNLPADFDDPFAVKDPETTKTTKRKASDELSKILSQIFPFVLVMWSLAGALYPAVDVCAGEKERGTMETLLISPASREEIVWGKFLTIWVFSAATALLNLLSMGLTTSWFFKDLGDLMPFRLSFLFWGAILLLPLSAFFSALCLAVGVYARSSKEGQYYLMPLFMLTMPLVFLTLAPGVELNHFYSMVPVTGVALLLQSLMKSGAVTGTHWMYFVPVLAPMVIYCWLALRWAIEQFQREEVLFREAERLDVGLWLKRLFRDKELLPSTGQALFCFLLVLVLHWFTLSAVASPPTLTHVAVSYLVSVTVPLFMALMLTRRPAAALGLRQPPGWSWPIAVLLAVLLFLPGVELTYYILNQFPAIRDSLQATQPLLREKTAASAAEVSWVAVLVVLSPSLGVALIQAIFEELTFRGFLLNGLRRRFKPGMAIFISAFLFAVFQMNVFQCVPHFALGAVLGFLTYRSGSVLPAIVLHFVYNGLVNLLFMASRNWPASLLWLRDEEGHLSTLALALGAVSAVLAVCALAGIPFLRRRSDVVEAFAPPEAKKA